MTPASIITTCTAIQAEASQRLDPHVNLPADADSALRLTRALAGVVADLAGLVRDGGIS